MDGDSTSNAEERRGVCVLGKGGKGRRRRRRRGGGTSITPENPLSLVTHTESMTNTGGFVV